MLSAIINCFCYAMIAYGVFRGVFKIGDYTLYTGALTSITANVSSLIAISATIYEGTLFIDNLITFMKEKQTVVPIKKVPEKVVRNNSHTIEFRNVSFVSRHLKVCAEKNKSYHRPGGDRRSGRP